MALTDLGLTDDQEQLYYVLLDRPELAPADLPDYLRRAPEAVDADLAALAKFGLISLSEEQPRHCTVKNPAAALGRLVDRREEELLSAYRRVSETRAQAFARVLQAQQVRAASPVNEIETVSGLDDVREKLDELSFFARSSVLSVQPGGPQSVEAITESQRPDQRGIRRGLLMRVIHDVKVLDDEANRNHLRDLVRYGIEARLSSKPLSRMVIFDEQVAVTAIDPANSRRGALIVRQPGLVAGFVELFRRLWDDSEEIQWNEVATDEEPGPGEFDRRILAELALGHTDEVAAKRLGCSVRTLRRQVARLMDELGASSRFEAGVAAARRGWLPPEGI